MFFEAEEASPMIRVREHRGHPIHSYLHLIRLGQEHSDGLGGEGRNGHGQRRTHSPLVMQRFQLQLEPIELPGEVAQDVVAASLPPVLLGVRFRQGRVAVPRGATARRIGTVSAGPGREMILVDVGMVTPPGWRGEEGVGIVVLPIVPEGIESIGGRWNAEGEALGVWEGRSRRATSALAALGLELHLGEAGELLVLGLEVVVVFVVNLEATGEAVFIVFVVFGSGGPRPGRGDGGEEVEVALVVEVILGRGGGDAVVVISMLLDAGVPRLVPLLFLSVGRPSVKLLLVLTIILSAPLGHRRRPAVHSVGVVLLEL
mmetsp:Transcript_48802/g.147039  ORF Transcript_48802/g.147039 Transcript_48802/m.147039 type:complete len:316 (+) Transcript_48802:294-1241(+)